ncbi:MAG: aconitate hydratase, partial [Syntrophobacteraceae bacterium CG07_land_8_20_14_0_80_61_8]
ARGVAPEQFNSYGARRGNHEVMMRGTFANIRIKNRLLAGKEGSFTITFPDRRECTVHEAALAYREQGTPLVVLGGREYGSGSSRDWAAKGPMLLGIRAVLAQSFERIHRSNLVGMGVLPLVFEDGESYTELGLDGSERFTIRGIAELQPHGKLVVEAEKSDGTNLKFTVTARLDTEIDLAYFRHGGILPYVLRQLSRG